MRAYGPALREMSEIAVLNANYLMARLRDVVRAALRPALHARVRALGAHAQARARRLGARRREAADGLRHPPADDLLPARRARGADDRADRDRDEGAPRHVRRRDARRSRARLPRRPSVAPRGAAARVPSVGSTRCKAAKEPVVRFRFGAGRATEVDGRQPTRARIRHRRSACDDDGRRPRADRALQRPDPRRRRERHRPAGRAPRARVHAAGGGRVPRPRAS